MNLEAFSPKFGADPAVRSGCSGKVGSAEVFCKNYIVAVFLSCKQHPQGRYIFQSVNNLPRDIREYFRGGYV